MLGYPSIWWYSFSVTPASYGEMVNSDNPSSADNQQETGLVGIDPWWVVGFVDGEGCFSVSIHANRLARPTSGWHVQPTFQVSQHIDHIKTLEALTSFFGCGAVRLKGPNSAVAVYAVYSTLQLVNRILPFFEQYPLRVKRDDFEKFAHIVREVRSRRHHDPETFEEIVRLAYTMNIRGKQRGRPIEMILPGSSETVRQALKDQQ
jgi:hypothetical protein